MVYLRGSIVLHIIESPDLDASGLSYCKVPGGDLLSHAKYTLSSAQLRFTVLFGMGRGGSKALWPPSVTITRK